MPRGPVIYSPPPGTVPQAPNTVISSSMFNNYVDDVTQTFNAPTPIEYGGTGGVHGGPNKTASGSLGVSATPAGIMDNGKGIALGDNDSGIRQNGDGIIEVVVNGVAAATANFAVEGGTLSLRGARAFGGYEGGNFDARIEGDVLCTREFIALGNSIMISGGFQIDQTGGSPTVVYGQLRLRDLSNNVIAALGLETRIRSSLGAFQIGAPCSLTYSAMTIGRSYRIELFIRKQEATGPVLIQDRTISAIQV